MGAMCGYRIQGHVYTAPQMIALRLIVAGHQIGTGSGPRRTANILERLGCIKETAPDTFQATDFGRQVAAIADHRDAMPPQAESANRIVTDHLNEFWDYLYSHPKTYHYQPPKLRVVCERSRNA
ncbi:hypothetical protein [Bifidobacterium moukalabense]|uniref:hypothetical protein n=1 Tax=Bifidobacterium moukalabense TaxID=1333651 RepID=UPI0010F70B72|nr:hypothetical protein [Bifidobacterium moukalabense]